MPTRSRPSGLGIVASISNTRVLGSATAATLEIAPLKVCPGNASTDAAISAPGFNSPTIAPGTPNTTLTLRGIANLKADGVGRYQSADLDFAIEYQRAHRRFELAVVEIDLRLLYRGLRGADRRLRGLVLLLGGVVVGLRHDALLHQMRIAREIRFGLAERGAGILQFGLSFRQAVAIGVVLDDREHHARCHRVARLDIAQFSVSRLSPAGSIARSR